MADERVVYILAGDAAPVVGYADKGHAAVFNLHRYGGCPRIDGVFYQFFDNRGGAFHHLARGNQLRNVF